MFSCYNHITTNVCGQSVFKARMDAKSCEIPEKTCYNHIITNVCGQSAFEARMNAKSCEIPEKKGRIFPGCID